MPYHIHTMTSSLEEATRIAKGAIEQDHAVSAHIDEVKSLYPWNGELKQETEWRLELLCADRARHALTSYIVGEHSYDLPPILETEVKAGTFQYGAWVDSHGKPST